MVFVSYIYILVGKWNTTDKTVSKFSHWATDDEQTMKTKYLIFLSFALSMILQLDVSLPFSLPWHLTSRAPIFIFSFSSPSFDYCFFFSFCIPSDLWTLCASIITFFRVYILCILLCRLVTAAATHTCNQPQSHMLYPYIYTRYLWIRV